MYLICTPVFTLYSCWPRDFVWIIQRNRVVKLAFDLLTRALSHYRSRQKHTHTHYKHIKCKIANRYECVEMISLSDRLTDKLTESIAILFKPSINHTEMKISNQNTNVLCIFCCYFSFCMSIERVNFFDGKSKCLVQSNFGCWMWRRFLVFVAHFIFIASHKN